MANFRGIGDVAIDVANRQEQERLQQEQLNEQMRANRAQEKLARSRLQLADRQATLDRQLKMKQLDQHQSNIDRDFQLKNTQLAQQQSNLDRDFQLKQAQDERRASMEELALKMKNSQFDEYLQAANYEREQREAKKRAHTDGFMGMLMLAASGDDIEDSPGIGVTPEGAINLYNAQNTTQGVGPKLVSFAVDKNNGVATLTMEDQETGEQTAQAMNITELITSLRQAMEARRQSPDELLRQSADYGDEVMNLTYNTLLNAAQRNSRYYHELRKIGMARQGTQEPDGEMTRKEKIDIAKARADIQKSMSTALAPLEKERSEIETELNERKKELEATTKKKTRMSLESERDRLAQHLEEITARIQKEREPFQVNLDILKVEGEAEGTKPASAPSTSQKVDPRTFSDPEKQDAPKDGKVEIRAENGGLRKYVNGKPVGGLKQDTPETRAALKANGINVID